MENLFKKINVYVIFAWLFQTDMDEPTPKRKNKRGNSNTGVRIIPIKVIIIYNRLRQIKMCQA